MAKNNQSLPANPITATESSTTLEILECEWCEVVAAYKMSDFDYHDHERHGVIRTTKCGNCGHEMEV